MDIEILKQKLEITENQGLDILDPRFNDIITFAQNGDYISAANGAAAIFEEGIYDIRIVGYFLYGIFLENGICIIASVFNSTSYLLRENWDAIGPVKNRDKHAKTSLGWFLKQLFKKMQYEEKKEGDYWKSWTSETSSDDIQEALDSLDELRKAVSVVLTESAAPVLDALVKIKDWLTSLQKLVYVEPDIESDVEEEPENETEEESEADLEEAAEQEVKEKKKEGHAEISENAVFPEFSYHFKMLLKKLALFEQLIGDEKFDRAALVSADINNIIENFDPQVYFPETFANFRKLYTINISEITQYEKYKKTVCWKAMLEFYKVDIDEFGSFSGNLMSSQSNLDESNSDEDNTDENDEDGYNKDDDDY